MLVILILSFFSSLSLSNPCPREANFFSLALLQTQLVSNLVFVRISQQPLVIYSKTPSNPLALSFVSIKMPSTQALQPRSPPTYPIGVPGKSSQYTPLARSTPYSRPAISPPQPGSSANTSAVPSLTSGSYSGSAPADENSNTGASGVDLIELLNDRLSNAVDPLPLDRSLAKQAQTWVPNLTYRYSICTFNGLTILDLAN